MRQFSKDKNATSIYKMAYVYRHVRLDKNEVFYVGISKKDDKHRRAHSDWKRSAHWYSICKKTPIEVEIMVDDITLEEAKLKEIEFIALYKRKSEGGTLVNLTLGGDGGVGYIMSAEQREKIGATHRGKPSHRRGKKMAPEFGEKVSAALTGKTYKSKGRKKTPEERAAFQWVYDKIEYKKGLDHHSYGTSWSDDTRVKMQKVIMSRGHEPGLSWTEEDFRKYFMVRNKKVRKAIIQMTPEGRAVGWFDSLTIAIAYLKCSNRGLIACLKGRQKQFKGFVFMYDNEASRAMIKC